MEKKLLLAIVLSILVLWMFSAYMAKMAPQATSVQPEAKKLPDTEDPFLSLENAGVPLSRIGAGEIKVETDLLIASINLNGGGVKSWSLREYKDKEGELIDLVRAERVALTLPLNVIFPGSSPLIFQGNEGVNLGPGHLQGRLFLEAQDESWGITRKLSFDNQKYLFWLELNWKNLSSGRRKLPDYYLICSPEFGPKDKENQQYTEIKAGFFEENRLRTKRWKGKSLAGRLRKRDREGRVVKRHEEEKLGLISWVAGRIKYFTIIIKPEEAAKGLRFSGLGDDEVLCQLKMPGKELEPGEILSHRFAVYMGPIEYARLKGLNMGLESIFESGPLSPLRRLVMVILKFFYNMVGNWGIAIILLTVVAKIVLLPLTQKSFRSMKEMQKLQPQIASLRQVYKNTPQTLQKEIMELYRRHKVNPLGGCFPMLFQMPVFIALFTALRTAIELRQSPFVFWIQDLSAKDPFYVLPILMGAGMFLQQKITPSADPQQARMAMIMPIFFTFLFMNFPSGLVLYWLVNSVLSLGEQWWIRKEK